MTQTNLEDVKKPRIDWADPQVPVGDAPPMSIWPAVISGMAWVLWIAFLIVMALARFSSHGA